LAPDLASSAAGDPLCESYGPPEKQAMLEAPDLKTRAEILVALTEIELAKSENDGETKLQ